MTTNTRSTAPAQENAKLAVGSPILSLNVPSLRLPLPQPSPPCLFFPSLAPICVARATGQGQQDPKTNPNKLRQEQPAYSETAEFRCAHTQNGTKGKSTAPQTPGLVLGQCSVGRCWPLFSSKNTRECERKGPKQQNSGQRETKGKRALVGQVWSGTSLAARPKINKSGPGWARRARSTAQFGSLGEMTHAILGLA